MEASIGRDRGQEPSNRECPDHIGAVGTYESRGHPKGQHAIGNIASKLSFTSFSTNSLKLSYFVHHSNLTA